MKVAFFDTKQYEEDYLNEHLDSSFEKHFYKYSLNCSVEIGEDIKDCEILSVFISSNLSRKVLEKFSNLKFIVLRSVGFSHVDLTYAKENNIHIFNAPHYGDNSIAEFVFALLLGASRRVVQASLDVKKQSIDDESYRGVELFGKTIGIIGLGAIGKQVARIAKSFQMNVFYYDTIKTPEYQFLELNELCEKSDIISINCPLTSKTLHMFDSNRFEKVKNGVIIINTARGEIIDSKALYEALLTGKVSYAGLDVTECENILYEDIDDRINLDIIKENCFKNYYITRKFLNMDNVLVTPHIAYNTIEASNRILKITVENLIASTKFTTGAKNLVLI